MKEKLTNEEKDFRVFCVAQVQRLGFFRQFEFMAGPAQNEYRKWLERKCGTRERVERIMDAAVEMEQMPTIADLNRLKLELFGDRPSEPAVTLDERKARAEYLSAWYAQEAREAEERRITKAATIDQAAALAGVRRPLAKLPVPVITPITQTDIDAAIATLAAVKVVKA